MNPDRHLEWFKRMIGAGWTFYLFADNNFMWRHADEPVYLSIPESRRLYEMFLDIGGILDPYQVQTWQNGEGTINE